MARQRLGQHFLVASASLERISEAACPSREPLVVEVGAGRGSLTDRLLKRADHVVAIEIDTRLVEYLKDKYREEPRLTLVGGDVLRIDLGQWGPAVVAGNLPYYITSPILKKILDIGPLLRRAVLLVQKEVAERLTAEPGSRDYGFLTVQTKLFARPKVLFPIGAKAFRPPPKVDSAVVGLEPHSEATHFGINDTDRFLSFVGLCFRQKRKTLRNNLRGTFPKPALEGCPQTSLRAEQLSIKDFVELYQRLSALQPEQVASVPQPRN